MSQFVRIVDDIYSFSYYYNILLNERNYRILIIGKLYMIIMPSLNIVTME